MSGDLAGTGRDACLPDGRPLLRGLVSGPDPVGGEPAGDGARPPRPVLGVIRGRTGPRCDPRQGDPAAETAIAELVAHWSGEGCSSQGPHLDQECARRFARMGSAAWRTASVRFYRTRFGQRIPRTEEDR